VGVRRIEIRMDLGYTGKGKMKLRHVKAFYNRREGVHEGTDY